MVRRASWAVAVAALSGCGYFVDLGGLSEDAPPPGDAGVTDAASSSGDDAAAPSPTRDAATAVSAYRAAVLADTPTSYWPMDEAPGSIVAKDILGGRDATLTGRGTFGATGIAGTALSIPDRDAFLEVGDVFDFAGQVPFTVEAWVLPKLDATFTNVASKRTNGLGWVLYFRDNGQVQFEQSSSGGERVGFSEGAARTYDRPVHVVVTYDGSKLGMYLDGEKLLKTFQAAGAAGDLTTPLQLAGGFAGVLDEIAIYDRALPADRVAAHRAAAGF